MFFPHLLMDVCGSHRRPAVQTLAAHRRTVCHRTSSHLALENTAYEWFQPAPVAPSAVGITRLNRRPNPGGFRGGEFELFGGDGERGIPDNLLLAGDYVAFQFDRALFVGVEGDAILDDPDSANGSNVRPLRAEERVQVQSIRPVNPS